VFHSDPKKAGKKIVEEDLKVQVTGKYRSGFDPQDIRVIDK